MAESLAVEARGSEGGKVIWQRRFWEHTITNNGGLARHVDYIHFNPVEHGDVIRVVDWQWPSFHRYVKEGMYDPEWGQAGEYWGEAQFGG